ncbi:MAG: ImmA/IrrE family metallo-endopeptidase [Thermomicrobia bacterium]|nr:ImmA/IrrE family metallo-endopeptidase [Thermomicrobia bacterium]
MATTKFYNERMVEDRAADVLRRFCTLTGDPLTLPVPVEHVAEDLCDLGILWEPIPEGGGRTALAELRPAERLVVFNETRRPLFDDTPFLYNTVLAHEVGHWWLHVDRAMLDQPTLPGFVPADLSVHRHDPDSWEERHAKWFASRLLLPRPLLAELLVGREIHSLADMYRLRDQCQVTLTVMRIALEHMGRGYIDEDGRVHPSRQEYHGQQRLN